MTVQARPFLKWLGGKSATVPELLKHVPKWYETYREPFLGGGALFFALRPTRAVLSDSNPELIAAFRGVRDDIETVILHLRGFARNHGPRLFEEMRNERWQQWSDAHVAARMIYLNKTCFNGLYRVNADGVFNAPMGKFKSQPTICDEENLRACSEALRLAQVECWDFQYATRRSRAGDLIYFDPPYIPSSDTSSFTSYTSEKFTERDHRALAWSAADAKACGATVLISAAGNAKSRELYGGFDFHRVTARRAINSDGAGRGVVEELICT